MTFLCIIQYNSEQEYYQDVDGFTIVMSKYMNKWPEHYIVKKASAKLYKVSSVKMAVSFDHHDKTR